MVGTRHGRNGEWAREGKLKDAAKLLSRGDGERRFVTKRRHMICVQRVGVFDAKPGGTAGVKALVPADNSRDRGIFCCAPHRIAFLSPVK